MLKRLICLIWGHNWATDFNPKKDMNKSTKFRIYCSRCGVIRSTIVPKIYREPEVKTPGREQSPVVHIERKYKSKKTEK